MKRIIFRFLVVLIVASVIFLKISTIEKVSCISMYGKCGNIVERHIELKEGRYLFLVKKDISNDLKSENTISGYHFRYKYPNTLLVYIDQNKQVYAIKNLKSNNIFLIDKKGYVLEVKKDYAGITLEIDDFNIGIGNQINEKHLYFLKMLQGVVRITDVKSAYIDNNSLKILLDNGLIIYVDDGDINYLLGGLNLILSRLNEGKNVSTMENAKRYNEIDLRYKNPLLR